MRNMIKFNDFSIEKENRFNILNKINKILSFKSQEEYDKYINENQILIEDSLGYKNVIGTSSGTSALQISLLAKKIKKNDEVIIPHYTYIATALAVINIGAIPVLCKTKQDLTIDINDLKSKITAKTKAIIPVHIHGNICDMEKIYEICNKHKLHLIEDCSQAQGGAFLTSKNKYINVGSYDIGCFSMHTSKICGGFGNSGIITCNDEDIEKINTLQCPEKCLTITKNGNCTPSKINAFQIAIINEKIKEIKKTITHKKHIASIYNENISNNLIKKINLNHKNQNVYRDYCIELESEELINEVYIYLLKNNIETKIRQYNLNKNKEIANIVSKNYKIKEINNRHILCLPCNSKTSTEDASYISRIINSFKN